MANQKMAEFWAAYAPTWLELEDDLEAQLGGIGRLAMEPLVLGRGHHVIDVGCGSGTTTRELARRVAPDGTALGVDIAAEMLELARRKAADEGVDNVEFLRADAQVHDLGEHRFDSAYSRLGVMFFADPVAAFANIRRALKPGGQLVFLCFQPLAANEWTLVPAQVAMAVTGTPPAPPDPDRPDPFSLSDPERVRQILNEAGYESIHIEPRADWIVTPEDRISETARTRARIGAVARVLVGADDATRARVIEAIAEEMRSRVEDGEVRLSRGTLLVTARA